jgi:hypothetical protein
MITSKLYSRDKIDPVLWDKFISNSPQKTIYAASGYLDAVCPGWSAIICKSGPDWIGVLPVNVERKFFQQYSLKPPWTQYLGIFFGEITGKLHRVIHLKKIIIESIILAIPPKLKLFNHNFSPQFDYFIPFNWHRFEVRPMQSYHLSLENPLNEIYHNFSKSVRSRITRAIKLNLKYIENNAIDNLVNMMLARKIITADSARKLHELWKYITANSAGFVLYVTDPVSNQVYCAAAFVIDNDRVVLLASALDFRHKKTGADPFLVWKGIEKAHQITGAKIFDFEGSMIRTIENHNRAFGARPVVYYNISRNNLSLPYALGFSIKQKIRSTKTNKVMDLVTYVY